MGIAEIEASGEFVITKRKLPSYPPPLYPAHTHPQNHPAQANGTA